MFKIIYELIISHLPNVIAIFISLLALGISFYVMYQNYLKPFKLFILTSHYVPWVNEEDFLCLDLSIDFFNTGKIFF
jgi:hypothetical protein